MPQNLPYDVNLKKCISISQFLIDIFKCSVILVYIAKSDFFNDLLFC